MKKTAKPQIAQVLTETTPLEKGDCFYISDRYKTEFSFPIHRHEEIELNFIENGAGALRVVGDSTEVIEEYELVLIASPWLEHEWAQNECISTDIHEVTIQFSIDFISSGFIHKSQFESIREMFKKAKCGLAFPTKAIMNVYHIIKRMAINQGGFSSVLDLLLLLHELSLCNEARPLSSSSFAKTNLISKGRRISKIQNYVSEHYFESIKLETLAALVDMTPVSVSRFFHKRTGVLLWDYITDVRIGMAARKLVDTDQRISEICYDCGFNTPANFFRLFKRKKGCSPKEFRDNYHKKKIVV